MTTTFLSVSSSLLSAVDGAAVGGLSAAAVLTRARMRGWTVSEPWAITAAWSLLGAVTALTVLAVGALL